MDPHSHHAEPAVLPEAVLSPRNMFAQTSDAALFTGAAKPSAAAGAAHSHSHGHGHGHHHDHSHDEHHHQDDHGGHDHSRGMRVGLLVLAGMLVFFLVAKASRLRAAAGGSASHGHSHSHSHSHGDPQPERAHAETDDAAEGTRRRTRSSRPQAAAPPVAENGGHSPANSRAEPPLSAQQQQAMSAKLAADLSILGDIAHNFTDGMAIAASFQISHAAGVATTLAVLVHEIPHEFGDFALLINGGYSIVRAIVMQLVTALGAFAGCSVVLIGASSDALSATILPFTAGGFIYIALVEVVPQIMESNTWQSTICEVLAMVAGVSGMVAIAAFE